MGYDLHITRAPKWTESKDYPIAESAWLAIVAADPSLEFRPHNHYEYRDSRTGEHKRVQAVVWADRPGHDLTRWFARGEITCKNPDAASMAKMKQIAQKLGARVLGDDGEEYWEQPDGSFDTGTIASGSAPEAVDLSFAEW